MTSTRSDQAADEIRSWIEQGYAKQADPTVKDVVVRSGPKTIAQGFKRLTEDERIALMEVVPLVEISFPRYMTAAIGMASAPGLADWLEDYWADLPIPPDGDSQDNWVRLATIGGRGHDAAMRVGRMKRFSSYLGVLEKISDLLGPYALDDQLADWLEEAYGMSIAYDRSKPIYWFGTATFSFGAAPFGLALLLMGMDEPRRLNTIKELTRLKYDMDVVHLRDGRAQPWMTARFSEFLRGYAHTPQAATLADTFDQWVRDFPVKS